MSASPATPKLGAVSKRLKKITSQITAAHRIVENGNPINLEGLETIVNDVCEDIRDLPGDQQKECKDLLVILIDEFDRLSTLLESKASSLQGDIKGLANRQRAATAYGGADGSTKSR